MDIKLPRKIKTKQDTALCLRMAAEVILREGYVKGIRHVGYNTGAVCALGAIERAVGEHAYMDGERFAQPAINALCAAIPDEKRKASLKIIPDASCQVASWNNDMCNSAEEVACVMRAAAEIIEEELRDEHQS